MRGVKELARENAVLNLDSGSGAAGMTNSVLRHGDYLPLLIVATRKIRTFTLALSHFVAEEMRQRIDHQARSMVRAQNRRCESREILFPLIIGTDFEANFATA